MDEGKTQLIGNKIIHILLNLIVKRIIGAHKKSIYFWE